MRANLFHSVLNNFGGVVGFLCRLESLGLGFGGVPSGIGGCQGAFNLSLGGLGLAGCWYPYPVADGCGVARAGAGLDEPAGWGD